LSAPAIGEALTAKARTRGFAAAFGLLGIWAGFLIFSRLSAQQALTPWDLAALRYAGAFLVALPFALVLGLPRLPFWRMAAMVATASLAFPLLAFQGFAYAPASHGGVLMPGMLPFWTAALGVMFLGDSWGRQRLISLAVVASGIALLAADTFGAHPGAWRGDLLFLAASFCWSVFTILLRVWRVAAVPATLLISLAPAPLYLPVWWLFLPTNLEAVSWGTIGFHMAFQGTLATVLSGLLFTRAVIAIGAARTTAVTALTPALAALAAWPLLGEPLGIAGMAGVALVSAGMILGVAGKGAR
jgi:drug/metabolite transporter (DMT)-like permease